MSTNANEYSSIVLLEQAGEDKRAAASALLWPLMSNCLCDGWLKPATAVSQLSLCRHIRGLKRQLPHTVFHHLLNALFMRALLPRMCSISDFSSSYCQSEGYCWMCTQWIACNGQQIFIKTWHALYHLITVRVTCKMPLQLLIIRGFLARPTKCCT